MITFNNIVERFKIFADAHFFVKSFSFGSPDDVDLSKFTSFPLMHLVYTGATYDAGTKTYNLEVYILDVPADKTKKTDRQKEVVSDAEQCAEDIIADIKNGGNIFLFAQDYEVVNATTTPLEEETKNVLSGVLLDLSVSIPYEWDACNAPIDGVSPEGGDEIAYARRGILRMLTQDGATDVLSVRTIKVTNGTLTDNGDGVVTLDTAGAESLDELTDVYLVTLENNQILRYQAFSLPGSPAGWKNQDLDLSALSDTKGTPVEGHLLKYTGGFWQPSTIDLNDIDGVTVTSPITGNVLQYSSALGWYNTNLPTPSPPPSTTDALPEGSVNLYYTEARVSANADVAANTAKVGITAQQAADILNNNAKVGITTNQADAIVANTAKVGIIAGGTSGQALVKASGTDYDTEWADIAIDTQYHNRYATEAAALRSGATATVELYYTAQADGDGYAESAESDTPATGYDIRRKLYYAESAQSDPDTGTWVQFADIADNTTFANAKTALLAYLKERTGGTVPISLKMTWEEVAQAPAFTGLLNETYGANAEAAYSVRRLNGNVTDCMVIRRASDSTTTTIGFDGSGNIDESAIETFCTGTTCTVVTWKDQSGNGNDATAAASTNEPTIYTGGALVKENGKVAVDFDGTDDNLQTSSVLISGTTARSIFSVVHADVTNDDDNIISLVNASTGTGSVFNYTIETAVRVAGFKSWTNNPMDAQTLGSVHVAANANVTDIDFYENGTLATSDGESAATIDTSSTGVSTIGKYPAVTGTELDGRIQELVMYASDKSSVRTSIESNIGDYFTQNTPLLDTYTGAAAAYSLRKLRTAYTGNAVTVRRASDNFTQGIGFNVFGELDTVSLAAFCGASDGFVDTWHDQSGNGNDATQGATANQPKIYDSVTGVVTENGKPAVEFDGLSDYIEFGESWGSDMSMFATWKAAATGEQQIYNLEDGGIRFAMSTNRSGDSITTRDNSGAGVGSLSGNPTITALGITSHITNSTSTSHSLHHNNVSLTGTQGSRAQNGTNTFGSASGGTAFYLNGVMSEAVLYLSDKTSDRTNIESNINTFYNIY
jgi:hypothetical protein